MDMDLACHEDLRHDSAGGDIHIKTSSGLPDSAQPPVKAIRDHTLLKDDRVLNNLLKSEDFYLPSSPDYFRNVQSDLTPPMRKMVAEWMLQVCQEVNSQPEIFCIAMNYMDRFLARCPVAKSHLQLVGSVCLLLSSKFQESCPIPGERIIFYTDFSITTDQLKNWELLVLQELQWELFCVTSLDFLDHLIARLNLRSDIDLLDFRRRTETILVLASTEYQFCYLNPSVLAVSGLFISLKCVSQMLLDHHQPLTEDGQNIDELHQRLLLLTNSCQVDSDFCVDQLMKLIPGYLLNCHGISSTPTSPAKTSSPLSDTDPNTAAPNEFLSEQIQNDSLSILVS